MRVRVRVCIRGRVGVVIGVGFLSEDPGGFSKTNFCRSFAVLVRRVSQVLARLLVRITSSGFCLVFVRKTYES